MRHNLAPLACAALLWAPLAAADALRLRAADKLSHTEIAVGHLREALSNHPSEWTDTTAELLHKFGERKLLIGRITASERFGLRDTTASLAGYYPLGERTTFYAEAAASGTHRVLPRDSLHLQLAHSIGGGWGVIGGVKRLHYNTTTVDIADLAVEYYFSDFRVALTALPSRSSSAGEATSYRLQFGYYYGEENNVQLAFASGDEVDKPTGIGAVVKTTVRSTALYGRHWFARDWALTYTLGHTRQGESRRDAAGLGLRYRF